MECVSPVVTKTFKFIESRPKLEECPPNLSDKPNPCKENSIIVARGIEILVK